MATEKIVHEEKAQLDFSASMSYGDYLHLDEILNAQHPLSPAHDEMLFIVQHQTSELWMKLMLHELRAAIACIADDRLADAFKMLARVSRIMEQLVSAWTVLSTMTPPEYTAMRPYLASSSGFQSAQYRCIEFALGNKNAAMLKPHAHRPDLLAQVEAAYHAPSLYDEALRLLARRGIAVPADHIERDWTQGYEASAGVEQAWLTVYRDPHAHRPDLLARVEAAWRAPSLYDEALRLLARRSLPVPASHTGRDWTQAYVENDAVEAAW
ncbi:MAG: tryptophan 2,3-dioxygenase family protein, partial [Variovorax sp.]